MDKKPIEFGIAPPLHEPPRSSRWPWVVPLVAVPLVLGALAFGNHVQNMLERTYGSIEPHVMPSEPPVPSTQVVVFEVTGAGKAFSVTATAGTSVHTEQDVTLPWTRTVEVPAGAPTKPVVLVVVAGPDGAEVHGKYTIARTPVREGKASGPYGVLTITDS